MDSINRAAVTPNKSRLARTFAKVLRIRAVTGVSPADGVQKTKKHDEGVQKTKARDQVKHDNLSTDCKSVDEEDEKPQRIAAAEAYLAKLFSSVSSIKAAYAQMQFAQSPYDGEGIQSADEMVVSELKILSELKLCHLKKHYADSSPETTQLLAEIQEQKSLLKTFEIMGKKLDSELKLKNSELTFLREKLDEANRENKLLEKRLNLSGALLAIDNLHFSTLSPSHFITVLKQTIKTIRSCCQLKPKSTFAKFCCTKYLLLIHPKMEASLFGNLNQRHSVGSGEKG